MKLTDKTILLTGGTSGIGLELVRQLQERGAKLVVIARSRAKLDELEERYDAVTAHQCDLSQRHRIEEVMEKIIAQHPDISVFINNAAVQFTPTFLADDFDHSSIGYEITTNLTAPLWMISLMLSGGLLLRQNQALIVNLSSGLAYCPKTSSAVYCATKAALHSVSQSLRYQLEATPVAVAEVFLPLVDTPMTRGRGRGKLTPGHAARAIIAGIEAGRDEIHVGMARLLPLLMRIAPGIAKNIMKRS